MKSCTLVLMRTGAARLQHAGERLQRWRRGGSGGVGVGILLPVHRLQPGASLGFSYLSLPRCPSFLPRLCSFFFFSGASLVIPAPALSLAPPPPHLPVRMKPCSSPTSIPPADVEGERQETDAAGNEKENLKNTVQ